MTFSFKIKQRILKEKRAKQNLAVIREYKLLPISSPEYTKQYEATVSAVNARRNPHLTLVKEESKDEQ
jgi:hypothetical protein